MEELKWFTSLGVGGILGGIIFFYYRKEFLMERTNKDIQIEAAKLLNERLMSVMELTARAQEGMAASMRELAQAIRAVEDRKRDELIELIREVIEGKQ